MPLDKSINPGFIVLQGNRLESLRDLLVEWLRRYPLAPLEDEAVLVQSNGMAQWLRLALGRNPEDGGLGIATALDLLLPARLQWRCYRAVMGEDRVPPEAPLDKPRLTWRLLRILQDSLVSDPVFAPLRHYVEDDAHRAYQLAERLADQFDQYQVYRSDWLGDWANGEDRLAQPMSTDQEPIPNASAWQPALWRAVLKDLQEHPPEDADLAPEAAGRALIHQGFLSQCEQLHERPAGLPRRIIVFGVSAMPPQVLDVLGAISRWVQVIFCLQNPCRHYWGDIVEDRHLFQGAYRRLMSRKLPESFELEDLHQHAHPLLASWGKQGRDLIRLVDAFDEAPERVRGDQVPLNIDLFAEPGTRSLLGQIQADLLDLTPMSDIEEQQRQLDDSDESIAFTIAHSPLREVEILQDKLLAAFDADPNLQPRDIIVMVPDMTVYAAAISAVFGRLERNDPRFLPYAISDRPERELHPMLRALDAILRLPESRLTASDVLDLLEVSALRARFGIAENDLPALRHWIENSGIRWALDAEHRQDFGLPPGIEQNSWAFGLDRLLYAYLSGPENRWHGIVPVGGLGGMDAAIIGPLAQLLDRIRQWRDHLMEARTPSEWQDCFHRLMDAFFAVDDIPPAEDNPLNPLAERESASALRDRLLDSAESWLADCRSAAYNLTIGLETARTAWLDRLDQHRLSQRFLVGAINFATLMPMRAIPFRQVYLLGMDDASYPRRQPAADFDLMNRRYRPGDRSRREDDRYLFLEALLSARERLWISWVGRSVRDNRESPPSVLVNQLRDHIDRGWTLAGEIRTPSVMLTTEHPLQPFSRRYFTGEELRLYSYADEWHRVHRPDALGAHAASAHATDTEEERPATLADLSLLLRKPWRVYFSECLDVPARRDPLLPEDDEPFTLGPLAQSQLSQYVLDDVSRRFSNLELKSDVASNAEYPLREWVALSFDRLAGAGQLPVQPFHEALQRTHGSAIRQQLETWTAFLAEYPLETDPIILPDALGIEDVIGDIRIGTDSAHSGIRLRLMSGRLHSGKNLKWHRLVAEWPAHLAAQLGGKPVHTCLISESDAHATSLMERPTVFDPVEPELARELLSDLVDIWLQARHRPMPIEPRSQIAWLLNDDHQRLKRAREAFDRAAEYEPELVRLWPDADSLITPDAYAALAERIYRPLLTALRGTHRERLEDAS